FSFLWKAKTDGGPTTPALLTGYIGYRGFRSLGYVGGGSGKITALDTDLGRIEWTKQVGTAGSQNAGAACPGGMTANVTRQRSPAITAAAQQVGGRGGGGAAKGDVGQPGEGSVILAQVAANAARGGGQGFQPPPAAPGGRGAAGRGPGGGGGGGGFGRQPNY